MIQHFIGQIEIASSVNRNENNAIDEIFEEGKKLDEVIDSVENCGH